MKKSDFFIGTTNFYISLFERQQIHRSFKEVTFNGKPLSKKAEKFNENKKENNSYIISYFPSYLKFQFNNGVFSKKVKHSSGLAINLSKKINNVEDYLKENCSTNFRKVTKRSVNRLETCFNIKYKVFHGEIKREECNLLMNKLHDLTIQRFIQKNTTNKALERWDYYTELTFNSINNKTASLFVIYDESTPIVLALNFHYDNLVISSLSSYDINYNKFSLGNIEIFKQIEWCLNNEIVLFDMCFGDFEYKRKWANEVYDFETYYVHNSINLTNRLFSFYHKKKNKLIKYLISKNVNERYHNVRDKMKGAKQNKPRLNQQEYQNFDCDNHKHDDTPLDLSGKDFSFLRRPVYDYLYKYKEHIDDQNVFKSLTDPNSYIVKGKTSKIGIKINLKQ